MPPPGILFLCQTLDQVNFLINHFKQCLREEYNIVVSSAVDYLNCWDFKVRLQFFFPSAKIEHLKSHSISLLQTPSQVYSDLEEFFQFAYWVARDFVAVGL